MNLFDIGILIGIITMSYIVYEVLKYDPLKT
jgi:hypothetical protein